MDWRLDQDNSELFNIVDMVWVIEEIEIARLQSLCDEHGINCQRFVEVWGELCDEAHKIINTAEEKMH